MGWLAIDPKGLLGEHGFDFAYIFCNPELSFAADPDRFQRRLAVVTRAGRLERVRLLHWTLAWCGLSAAFLLEGGEDPRPELLRIAEMSAAELDR